MRLALTLITALAIACGASAPAMADATPWYHDGPGGRILLNDGWLFRADPGDQGLSENWQTQQDTNGWGPVTLPNAWNAGDDSKASMAGSVGWYRRDFTLDAVPVDAQWIVRFESVNYYASVYLNGVLLTQHEGASLPFEAVLSNLQPGVNHLVVRVDSRRDATSLPPGPGGGWWNYSGILREAYLRIVNQIDISSLLTRTIGSDQLLVRAAVTNMGAERKRVDVWARVAGRRVKLGSASLAPRGKRFLSRRVTIPHPHLWSPRSPHLYAVNASAWSGSEKLATYTVHTGLRRLGITPGGQLTMNGRTLHLRGVNVHEQNVARGAALTPADHASQIALLRQLGATIVRAHYPLSEDFLERADRAGITVWEEIPFWQVSEKSMRDVTMRDKALGYLSATIRRDENHPSVILWSIGNELPNDPDWGQATWIRDASALAHQLDPTRPVALAFAGSPSKNETPAYRPVDVLGMNDYFGWFAGNTGELVNPAALGPYLDRLHRFYPRKALFVSEFGAEGSRDGGPDDIGSYAFQAAFMQTHLQVYAQRPWMSGAIAWLLEDFKARPGYSGGDPQPHPPWVYKGLVDPDGNLKPAWGATQQSFLRTQPLAAFASTRRDFGP